MIRSFRNILRFLRVAHILARHDALFLLDNLGVAPFIVFIARLGRRRGAQGRPGQRLARALSQAGPSFIKLGQALSTRSDLLGEEIAADLSELQDALPPFSGTLARQAIADEFGCPLESLFRSFDETPVAAASIAQVHFAVTSDGREVAVKVLRPDIEAAFARDLDLFYWAAQLIEMARPELRRLKPVEAVKTLEKSVQMEMDLRFEAAACAELAENFRDDPTFRVPGVDWLRTGRRVLCTERVEGIVIDDIPALVKAGHEPLEVLRKAAGAFFHQVFRDGFFHADMHPGNLFVAPDGAVVAVDFGIMGRLDDANRKTLAEMMLAFLTRDYRRAAEVHFEAGWIPADQSVTAFTQACRSIAEPIMDKAQNEISIGRLLGQLFQITETFAMEAQPQLLMLQKTMLVAEGTGRHIAPEANMWMLARPLVEQWAHDNLSPQARLRDGVQELVGAARRLPRVLNNLEKSLDAFSERGLKLHPDTVLAMRGGNRRHRSAILAFATGAVCAAAIIGVVLLV
ncbi:2-polyprenylphenol 6-hydroxylase [Varunaivibrio sulfuroxidans]|uniref:2-octaprenylphenol hydroxylase n=1 Tax=Varunaivibrio sulfuroxidans TaxID=1773489 RepID=A0A4R3JGS2_9PROT|nr:2-polyprenylphenol 6-hydroxylase [Varunaivibrio sulfuroxidans]TCS65117.1 2-octaprenylphenol hydroxylase [Varunaivibrio sulfuroxidans]WES29596.1 2-polyprenylphenol 6-hydroxylase [Varunaivibrio sulfuroxidans]